MLYPTKKKRFIAFLISLCLFMNTGISTLAAEADGMRVSSLAAEAETMVASAEETKTGKTAIAADETETGETAIAADETETGETAIAADETETEETSASSNESEGEMTSSPEEAETEDITLPSDEVETEDTTLPSEEAEAEDITLPSEETETEDITLPSDEAEAEDTTLPPDETDGEKMTVSGNETEVASENGQGSGPDADYLEYAAAAAKELAEAAEKKNILAIVYMTDDYPVKKEPGSRKETVATLASAHTVQVLGMEAEWIWKEAWGEYLPRVWYQVQFYQGDELLSGYIEEGYLAYSDEELIRWRREYSSLFPEDNMSLLSEETDYSDVWRFPTSYQVHLKKLKDAHPNWIFVPMNVNRNWEDCVQEQMGDYSWIYYNQPEEYRGAQINSSWYYASYAGISYYMDPRNFLTERNIFQFEQNTYNASYHTQEALQSFLNNTFMSGTIPGDSGGRTYAYTIWTSGRDRGLSPFNLAARVIQEQGVKGTSAMISGTYAGFEGYYNYYNIGASGTTDAEVLRNGLTYAKNAGWNTRYKSLYEGAAFIGNNYILKGQDTLYLQKFDVEKSRGYLHQYMQNIMAPYSEGRSMQSMYETAGSLNSAFVFKIPVFNNMPGANYTMTPASISLEKGKSVTLSLKCNGVVVAQPQDVASFSSDDPAVAEVSANGVVTAVGSGETIIRAVIQNDDGKMELTTKVKVYTPLKAIRLDKEEAELYAKEGKTGQVAVLNEEGKTEYLNWEDCPAETTLQVLYEPEDTTDDRTVNWTVEDEAILTLERDESNPSRAIIRAKAGGTTTVTAQVGKYTAECRITVRVPMEQASVNQTELTLHKGESSRLTIKYSPYTTTDRVEPEWYSEDEKVATIQNGTIVAVGEGSTRIFAQVGPFDGSQPELICTLRVEAYQVTFKAEDGTDVLTAKGTYGQSLEHLDAGQEEIPWTQEKEGSIFLGWYTEEGGRGDAVTAETTLYGDMTLYPYFIEENEETEFFVKPLGSYGYTGAYVKPEVEVYDGRKKLTRGVDYTLTYVNNRNVSTEAGEALQPRVIVRGRGAYSETAEVTFTILPMNVSYLEVSASDLLLAYTGKLQKAKPEIRDSNRTLQLNKDYTLEYPEEESGAYLEAGTYEILIQGKGNYCGSRKAYLTISKRILLSAVTVKKLSDMAYAGGEECRQEPILTYQGKTLKEGRDYSVHYLNNREIGTASLVITGKGSYIGSRTLTYEITGCEISSLKLSGIEDKEYTGEPIEQEKLSLKDKTGQELRLDTDYRVSYQNNIQAGKATVTITGMGGYQGSLTRTFTIRPYDMEKNRLTWQPEGGSEEAALALSNEEITLVYDKAGVKPGVTLTFKGEVLTAGKDYQLSWKNHTAVGTAQSAAPPTIVITGKGNFEGTLSRTFTILTRDIAQVNITAKDVKFKNRTGFCFVEPVLTDSSGRTLTAGTDYREELVYTYETDVVLQNGAVRQAGDTVEKTDIPLPGETGEARIRITVQGMGNYRGTTHCTYAILENTSGGGEGTNAVFPGSFLPDSSGKDIVEMAGEKAESSIKTQMELLSEGRKKVPAAVRAKAESDAVLTEPQTAEGSEVRDLRFQTFIQTENPAVSQETGQGDTGENYRVVGAALGSYLASVLERSRERLQAALK